MINVLISAGRAAPTDTTNPYSRTTGAAAAYTLPPADAARAVKAAIKAAVHAEAWARL